MQSPIFLKSYAPITHLSFSPSSPHRYLVTSGTRIQIYSPKTNRVVKTISRFKEIARSGEIRTDGKLCIAGDEGGLVQVFDINSRAILRTIRAHKQSVFILPFSNIAASTLIRRLRRAVHTTKFSPGAGTQILTTSSDTTVRLFDLSTSAPLRTFSLHTDYVRTASFVPSAPSLIFSGGYDGTVRLWDSRVPNGEGGGQVWLGRHGKPVEDVIVASSGTTAISAGGPIMRVWDLLGASTSRPLGEENEEQDTGTAQCLKALSNHQKTITSLCWAESEEGEARVLSGGLDGLVKVYDPQENWRVRHTMRYGGQVLSLAVSVSSSFPPCSSQSSRLTWECTAKFITSARGSLGRITVDSNARPKEISLRLSIIRTSTAVVRRSSCWSRSRRTSVRREGCDGRIEVV